MIWKLSLSSLQLIFGVFLKRFKLLYLIKTVFVLQIQILFVSRARAFFHVCDCYKKGTKQFV